MTDTSLASESLMAETPDFAALRADFPILNQEINGRPLAYLDNAASAQRPRQVVQALVDYYEHDHANVHRGVHTLSQRATEAYEGAREDVRRFINAASCKEIVFTRGTTEAVNLVAQSFARPRIGPGDEILITLMEHHSNIVPWQMVCDQTGATLVVVPIDDRGELMMDEFARLLGPATRLVAVGHVSNALGTINPVGEIAAMAHAIDVPVLLDGAQAVPHFSVDVQQLDCDFYAFSGHKMYAPTGIGVLYGRESLLDAMPPWQGGGEMIRMVRFDAIEYNDLPWKFEAGTPNIADAVGLGEAIRYLEAIGMDAIHDRDEAMLAYATRTLQSIPGLRIIGTAKNKTSVVSFVIDGLHPHDIGTIVDHDGIAIRTGHHCAMPVMEFFGLPATARASFAFYNTEEEIDRLADSLRGATEFFS